MGPTERTDAGGESPRGDVAGDGTPEGDTPGDDAPRRDAPSDDAVAPNSVSVTVHDGDSVVELDIEPGAVLRDVLLDAGLSPYTRVTRRANCGGRGLCATCGVRISEGESAAEHWHDRLADRFGYPRLSCQIRVEGPMTVELVEKLVWGGREG